MSTNKPPQTTASESKAPQTKSTTDTAPNPARFSNFTLLKDETGFRIPNCDHIFEFDIYGGWFDEYKNYYNADGQPQTPPEYDDEDDVGFDDDEAERLAREYDMGDDDYDDDLNHYDNIYLNAENNRVLQNYLKDQEINVEMRNINFNVSEDEFEKFLVSKKIEWLEFEFELDNRDRFKGVVYLTLDKPNAEKIIEFNGQRIFGRDIKINILKPADEEEDAQVIGGSVVPGTQEKQEKVEEKKSSWRAQPTEKATEATNATQAQPQTETQKQGQANSTPVSEPEKGQGSQQQQQQKSSGFERNQGYNANERQGNNQYNQKNQSYQQNQGYQHNQYSGKNQQGYQKNNYNNQRGQNFNQSAPIQRNQNFNQNQYQGQGNQNYPQYPQSYTQYPVQQNYQSYGYPPQQGQNSYMYQQQQYPNYQQQQWNAGFPQQGHGGYPTQQQYYGQNQNYQGQNPGFERNQIPQQNAPKVSGFDTLPGQTGNQANEQAQGEEDVNQDQAGWGKPLARKGKPTK